MRYDDPSPPPPIRPVGPAPAPPAPRPGTTPRWVPWALGGQAAVMAALVAAGLWWVRPAPQPGPGPGPAPPMPIVDYDPAFVPIGHALAQAFGRDFADSYEAGTKVLSAGQTRQMAADTASHAFSEARQKSFDAIASPALGKVVDPAKAESDITPAERTALARARRGISKGATP